MEIIQVKKTKTREAIVSVQISESEALSLIRSLTNQLIAGNPNVGRAEHYDPSRGTYFSIAVMGKDDWVAKYHDSVKGKRR